MAWGTSPSSPPSWLRSVVDGLPGAPEELAVLPGRTMGEGEWRALADAIKGGAAVRTLESPRGLAGDGACAAMAEAMPGSKMEVLRIGAGRLVKDAALARLVRATAGLRELALSGPGDAREECWRALAEAVRNSTTLSTVVLENHDIERLDGLADAAAERHARNDTLATLDVSSCNLAPAAAEQLGAAAASLARFVANHCGAESGDGILRGLVPKLQGAPLVALFLRDGGVSDAAASALASALGAGAAPLLADLSLARCNLSAQGLAALGTCVRQRHEKRLPALALDVSDNERVGDDAVAALADATAAADKGTGVGLMALDVSGTALTDRGAGEAARALGVGSRLCVNGAKLGANAAARLLERARGAGWLTECVHLRVCECDVDTPTLIALVDAVRDGAAPKLATLELGGNPCVGDLGADDDGNAAKDAVAVLRDVRDGIDVHVRAAAS